ncbi:MAG: hypothetical protein ACI39R_02250 [Lachnospiraceae bacterium]
MKNKTRDIIIIMAIATVIISGILVVVNVMNSKINNDTQDVTSQREWSEVSDNIRYMIQSSDLQVKYISSEQRIVLYLIGSEKYYGLMYNPTQKSLYLYQGTYTATATTDAQKINEACDNIDSGSGSYTRYAENISTFVVNGAGSDGLFADGIVDCTMAVEVDGELTRNGFKVEIPQATAEN